MALDIFVTLRSAYFKESEGQFRLIVNQSEVMAHNLRKWFILDLAVGFPYEALFNYKYLFFGGPLNDPRYWYSMVRFARCLKFLKLKDLFLLTRVGNMDYYISSIKERIALSQGPVRVTKFMAAFLYSLHVVSCVLFAVALWFGRILNDSWIEHVSLITTSTVNQNGVIRKYSSRRTLNDPGIEMSEQYLASLYYMTTTLTQVGYGDFLPVSFYELIVLSIAMVGGAGIFSYIVGNAEQFIIDFQGIDVAKQEQIDEVSRLLFEVIAPSKHVCMQDDSNVQLPFAFSCGTFEAQGEARTRTLLSLDSSVWDSLTF